MLLRCSYYGILLLNVKLNPGYGVAFNETSRKHIRQIFAKFFPKDSALTLNDAMKIARAEEATQKHVSALQETKTISAVKSTPQQPKLSANQV